MLSVDHFEGNRATRHPRDRDDGEGNVRIAVKPVGGRSIKVEVPVWKRRTSQ